MFIECKNTSEVILRLDDSETEDLETVCRQLKAHPQTVFGCMLFEIPTYLGSLASYAETVTCQDLADLY